MSIIHARQVKLSQVLANFILKAEDAASRALQEKVTIRLSESDQLKLYRVQLWSWQYKVSVEFIMKELLAFWTARVSKQFKRQRGRLGVRVSTLTNIKSKAYLVERIEDLFPNRENEAEWKVSVQMEHVPSSSERPFVVRDPKNFMAQYAARINDTRRRFTKLSNKVSRRHFRDNPFV